MASSSGEVEGRRERQAWGRGGDSKAECSGKPACLIAIYYPSFSAAVLQAWLFSDQFSLGGPSFQPIVPPSEPAWPVTGVANGETCRLSVAKRCYR